MENFPEIARRPSRRRPRPAPNIQDGFLFGNLKEGRVVALALTSGKAISGRIRRFDRYAILIETRGRETLVYKHAIVAITVTPG